MHRLRSTDGSGNWLKFARFYLEQTMKLCQVNPAGGQTGFGPPIERSQLPRWSLALQAFYVYFTLKLIVALMLQHKFNVLESKISTLNSEEHLVDSRLTNNDTWHSWRRQLEAEYDLTVKRSRFMGNALYELGFAAEPPIICALVLYYLGYLHIRFYCKYCCNVSLAALRMLLDPEREKALMGRSEIGAQANSFIASSEQFWLARRQRILGAYEWRPRGGGTGHAGSKFSLECQEKLRGAEQAHEHAVSVVCELAASGQLVPPNRRDEWLARLARTCGLLIISFMVLGLGLFMAIVLLFRLKLHTDRPLDLLFLTELLLYDAMGLACISFYLVILILSALDQVELVAQLSRLVDCLTRDIAGQKLRRQSHVCHQHHAMAWHSSQIACSDYTRRLMRVLILYKQLLGQLHANQPFMGFVGAHTTLITLFVCALNHAYAPYLAREFRYVYLISCLFIIISCDFLVVPNCMLHSRCLQLFKSISCLLAHIDAHEEQMRKLTSDLGGAGQVLDGIDEHTVWLLRKQLHTPEVAARRLATSAYFLQLTYSSFLGIHFWCGLLMAPLFLNNTAHLSAGGNLLSGQLRIF